MPAYWSKKTCSDINESGKIQGEFEKQYMLNMVDWSPERRADMMLVLKEEDDGDVLYMCLPDTLLPYKGFEVIPNTKLPRKPSFLVGDQIGFEQIFGRA